MDFAIISVSNRTEKSKLTIAARIQHLRKAKGASQEEMKFFENARTVEKRYTIKINVCMRCYAWAWCFSWCVFKIFRYISDGFAWMVNEN